MTNELSISERIAAIVMRRLGCVKKADGFRTDAGLRVFQARRSLNDEELPAFVVWMGRADASNASGNYDSMQMVKSLTVEYHTLANQADTGKSLEQGLADGKKALLSRSNGGVGDAHGQIAGVITYVSEESNPRQDGDNSESVVMTFQVSYQEAYGDPYAAR